jgi:four helix bundle protein
MLKIENFIDLKIWRKGMEIINRIYRATGQFPEAEPHGMIFRMRRISITISSCMAECFRRNHPGEYRLYLGMALDAGEELKSLMTIAHQLDYVSLAESRTITKTIDSLCRMVRTVLRKSSENEHQIT